MYPKVFNDSWFLIFHHDATHGMFHSKEQAKYSLDPNKFSLLKRIDDSFKIDGSFEFLLMYPNLTGQNHWRQTVNPIHAEPNQENGYQEVNVSWKSNNWHGLAVSNLRQTYLDGSPFNGSTWFYSIGTTKYLNHVTIPGPEWSAGGKDFYEVNLWIRITNYIILRKLYELCTHHSTCHKSKFYLFIFSFFVSK